MPPCNVQTSIIKVAKTLILQYKAGVCVDRVLHTNATANCDRLVDTEKANSAGRRHLNQCTMNEDIVKEMANHVKILITVTFHIYTLITF